MSGSIVDAIAANPWLVVLGLILTVISTFSGFYFYIKGKKYKSVTYFVQNFNLINDKLKVVEGLDIAYKDRRVDNLSVAEVVIWNSGTETISGSDVAKKKRLTIHGYEDRCAILDYKIVHIPQLANDITVTPIYDETKGEGQIMIKALQVDFDYIDPRDGVSIQVFHMGNTYLDLGIDGAIKGVKNIKRHVEYINYRSSGTEFDIERKRQRNFVNLTMIANALICLYLLYTMYRGREYGLGTLVNVLVILLCYFYIFRHFLKYIIGIGNSMPPSWMMKDSIFK